MNAGSSAACEAVCRAGARLAARGLTPGTSGNISLRFDDGYVMTPTNRALGELQPEMLAVLDANGSHASGERATKECGLHLAIYARRPDAMAVVHVHSTSAVALACLAANDGDDVLPKFTPYAIMRVGRLPLVPYARPGTARLAEAVGARAGEAHALMLANHGPIFAGATLEEAIAGVEEIEEAARVAFLLHGRAARALSSEEIEELRS